MKKRNVLLSVLVCGLLVLPGSVLKAESNPDAVEVYEEKITKDVALQSSVDRGMGMGFSLKNISFDPDWNKHLANLRSAGITEVLSGIGRVSRFNKVTLTGKPNLDFMDSFLEAAVKQKMKIWMFYNWNIGSYTKESDKRVNLMSKKYLEGQYLLIDAIAEKNKKYGNILGFFWDEIWCAEVCHLYPDYVDSFKEFCKKEYNEEYPGDKMPVKQDPTNKWWRRFVVFKSCVYENFSQRLYDYTKKKGFQVLTRTVPSQAYGKSAWKWGLDSYRISKIGDYDWIPLSRSFEANIYENTIMSGYKDLSPLNFVWMLRGCPLSYLQHLSFYLDPEVRTKYLELVKLGQEWLGADRLAEIGILSYPVNLIGSFKNPSPVFRDNEVLLTNRLSRYFETDMLDIRDTRFYKKYKVLVASKYSANSIPKFAYDDLVSYVKKGGILLALDTNFAVGKRDLTNPRNVTEELCGIGKGKGKQFIGAIKFTEEIMKGATIPGKNKLQKGIEIKDKAKVKTIASSNNNPVITEYSLGKGKVIYANLGLADRINKDSKWLYVLANLISYYHTPAITSNGVINVESVIKKDNRVMVSLYPATEGEMYVGELKPTTQPGDMPPVEKKLGGMKGVIKIDVKALGLKEKEYQLFRLSEYKVLSKSKKQPYWSREDLEAGVPVTITEEAGFENIVIEKPGAIHKGESILARLKKLKEEEEKRIKQAKLHPLGLRKDPFKTRIRIKQSSSLSRAEWISKQPYRISLSIANSLNTERRGEPIIISAAELIKTAKNKTIQKSSLRIYELKDGAQTEIPSQIDSEQGKSKLLNKNDELVFVTTLLPNGKKEFLIYYSDKETAPAKYDGIKVTSGKDKKGKAIEVITTGLNKIELSPKGQLRIYDETTGSPIVAINGSFIFEGVKGAGSRVSSYRGGGVCSWAVKGAVHSQVILNTEQRDVKMQNIYDFYHNSPFIRIKYLSSAKGKCRCIYWPVGSLISEAATATVLTDKGWMNTSERGTANRSGLRLFKEKTKTVIKQGGTAPFGWLLCHSDIASPPYLLISKNKGGGYFYIEFSKYHYQYTPIDEADVEWVYVHNAGNEKQIDSYAERLKEPLVVILGKEERE